MRERDVLFKPNPKKNRSLGKKILLVTGIIIALGIIFLASFSWSYYKITSEKNTDIGSGKEDMSLSEKVKKLESELSEKEEQIEGLQLQIERYESIIDEMKNSGKQAQSSFSYSSSGSTGSNKKPTEAPTASPQPSPTHKPTPADVQGEVYKKPQKDKQ